MRQEGEKLILDSLDDKDKKVIGAAVYGLRLITLNGRNPERNMITDLSNRTEAAKNRFVPTIELTPSEAAWIARAVSNQIALDVEDLVCALEFHPLVAPCQDIAKFATAGQEAAA